MEKDERLYQSLKNQYLLEKAEKDTVVADLCGLQAQFANNPKYGLRIRAHDFSEETWNEGLAKIWSFRGTLHMVKVEEIGLYLSARGVKEGWEEPAWGLDKKEMAYWAQVIMEGVEEGVTGREDLKAMCRKKGMSQEDMDKVFHGWGGLVREMCDRGMIAYESGTAKRFMACRDTVFIDKDEARAELIRRYFKSYAPATLEDCARFTGYEKREVLRLIAENGIPLKSTVWDGTEYLHMQDLSGHGEIPPCLLLTGFDQLVMGYRDRSRFMDDIDKSEVITTTGIIHPTILLDGRLKAKWKKERSRLIITPFRTLTAKERENIIDKVLDVFSEEVETVLFRDGQGTLTEVPLHQRPIHTVKKREVIQHMTQASETERLESIRSFQSTIRKLEKALSQMTEKGANTTVVKKRLKSQQVGLAVLEHLWEGKAHTYTAEELKEAGEVMEGLFPSIEAIYVKTKDGSPQKTILRRRLRSLELAVQEIDRTIKG